MKWKLFFSSWACPLLAVAALLVLGPGCDASAPAEDGVDGEVAEAEGAEEAEELVDNSEPEIEHRPEFGPQELDDGGITDISDDPELAARGELLFEEKTCSECHYMDRSSRGPPLGGVTEKRTPQWLAKMIMHPERMVRLDPVAKEQLREYMCMMPDLGVTPEQTRALLAYLATQPEILEEEEE